MPIRLSPEIAAVLGTEWADDEGKPIYPTKPVTTKPKTTVKATKPAPSYGFESPALSLVKEAANYPKSFAEKTESPSKGRVAFGARPDVRPGPVPVPSQFERPVLPDAGTFISGMIEGIGQMPTLPGTPIPMEVGGPVVKKALDAVATTGDFTQAALYDFAQHATPGNIPFSALQAVGEGLKAVPEGLAGRHQSASELQRKAGVPEEWIKEHETRNLLSDVVTDVANVDAPVKLAAMLPLMATTRGAGRIAQKITSAATSIKQVPALLKNPRFLAELRPGSSFVNIGAGRFAEMATPFLEQAGVKHLPFDPFNRTATMAEDVAAIRAGKHQQAGALNVLNVIAEPEVRSGVIQQAADVITDDGRAFFQIHEGDGLGVGRETSKGWQNNRRTADYMEEVGQHFTNVERRGNVIIASGPKRETIAADVWGDAADAAQPAARAAEPATAVPSTVRAMDAGSPGWTAQANSTTGTYSLRGPSGEKLAGRLTGGADLEMKTIGKGNAPTSESAIAALRAFAERHGYQGIVFSSAEGQDVTAAASKMRDRLIARGEGERIAGGKFRLFTRTSGAMPPPVEPTRFAAAAGFARTPLVANTAGATVGALAGAAVDEDNRARGAVLGAAAGLGVAAGAVKLASLARRGAVSPAGVQATAQALDEAQDADKFVKGLITRVPDRAEAIGMPDLPVGQGPSYEAKVVGGSLMGTAKRMEDEARTYTWLGDRVGITDPNGRNMLMTQLEDGGMYYEARRMVTENGVPRGRTWARSENDASKIIWNEIPKKGMALNAEQMLSLERKVRGVNEYAVDLAEDYEKAKLLMTGSQADIAQAKVIMDHYRVGSLRAMELLADQAFDEAKLVVQAAMGARSEAGRTLNILKKKIRYRAANPSDDDYIRVASKLGADGKEIRVALTTLGTPEQKYQWLRSLGRPDFNQKFQYYYITSLLSGMKTHARNTISNLINVAVMDAAHMPGRVLDVARGKMTLSEAAREGRAILHGQRVGITRGWQEAINVWRNGFSAEDARILAEKPPEIRMSDIFNTTKFDGPRTTRYMNAVSRFLSASDQFVRTVVMSGALHAEAYTEARKLAKAAAAKGLPFNEAQYIDEFLKDPVIINEKAWERAAAIAKDAVYQQDPSKLLAIVMQIPKAADKAATKTIGGAINWALPEGKVRTAAHVITAPAQNIGTVIAPFVKTPANVFKKQFRMMGGGLITAGAEDTLGAALKRGEAMLGIAMMGGLAYMMNNEGRPMITGGGPNSAGLKDAPAASLDAFYASNRPNSIRIPGTDTWVDYRSMGPMAGPLSLMGNLSDAYHQSGKKLDADALASMFGRQARSLLSTSFLSGIMGLASVFEDRTGVSANRVIGRMGAGLVPLSGALRTARAAVDPAIRDTKGKSIPESFIHNVENITPGLSTRLPQRVDYAGEELVNPGGSVARMVSPFEVTQKPEDPIRARLAEIGPEAYLAKPAKDIKDLFGNPMNLDNIRSTQLQKAVGVAQYEAAKQLMAIPGFRELPEDQRALMLHKHMAKMRDLAKKQFRIRVASLNTATQ